MRTRRFTQDEIDIVRSIFGDELPERVLREYEINLRFRRNKSASMDCNGVLKQINVYGRKFQSEDYSRTRNAFNFGAMIHETAHIWQWSHRNEISGQTGYNYKLSRGCNLSDFGLEQQPSIIEDYVRVYLFNGHAPPWRTADTPENRELLKTVVEERFPEARKTRERLEAQRKLRLTEAQVKFIFNVASGITAKLDDLCNGSELEYDTAVWPGGQGIYFHTNVERDNVRTGENPMMTIWVDGSGSMGLLGEGRTATEKYILDSVTRRARQKGLIKIPAGSA
jgi:hypothetical protein